VFAGHAGAQVVVCDVSRRCKQSGPWSNESWIVVNVDVDVDVEHGHPRADVPLESRPAVQGCSCCRECLKEKIKATFPISIDGPSDSSSNWWLT